MLRAATKNYMPRRKKSKEAPVRRNLVGDIDFRALPLESARRLGQFYLSLLPPAERENDSLSLGEAAPPTPKTRIEADTASVRVLDNNPATGQLPAREAVAMRALTE